jgi:hypothetical protein
MTVGRHRIRAAAVTGLLLLPSWTRPAHASPAPHRVIEIVADKDNTFKVPGQKKPVIIAKPGEILTLKITSLAGPEKAKDGAVHSFVIKKLRDQGWDLRLDEGTKAFTLRAPQSAGKYVVECTVKCGKGHEEMQMTLIVKP